MKSELQNTAPSLDTNGGYNWLQSSYTPDDTPLTTPEHSRPASPLMYNKFTTSLAEKVRFKM